MTVCLFVCLFVLVLLPVCEYLSVSEVKSDQCFISCLFTQRCYTEQVSVFVCVYMCLKSNQINVLYCGFSQQESVFVCVCLCLK